MNHSDWLILDTGVSSAKCNMELDAKLLNELDPTSCNPILHLYEWEAPSTTYGHFIDPSAHFSKEAFCAEGGQLAKRPTGGGVIFHVTDWAFSVLVPASHKAYSANILDNYAFVNHLVMELISRFVGHSVAPSLLPNEPKPTDCHSVHFCMAKPTKYDVMVEGRKVGGGAQRRTKSGFLHQGTISLALPSDEFLERVLLPNTFVHQAMLENSYPLLAEVSSAKELEDARKFLAQSFKSIVLGS